MQPLRADGAHDPYAVDRDVRRRRNRPMPARPKPRIAKVEGSGTAATTLTSPITGPYGVPTSSLLKDISVLAPLAVKVKASA